jgi:predicted alpha/beta hydrolase family esterase
MKKALIIHGWESNPDDHWYQEGKAILDKVGFEVYIPHMPGHSFPIEAEWVKVVSDFEPDGESVLVGHSLGAPTILRYLENAHNKVGKVVLIAGFASSLHLNYPNAEYPDAFVNHEFDWDKIKSNVGEIIILNQDNDPWVPLEKGKEIADKTGSKLVVVPGNDHFDKMDLDLINKELI